VTADEAAIASSVAAGIVRFVLPVRTGIRLPWRVERN